VVLIVSDEAEDGGVGLSIVPQSEDAMAGVIRVDKELHGELRIRQKETKDSRRCDEIVSQSEASTQDSIGLHARAGH